MTVDSAIRARLLSLSSVTAIVGTRVYDGQLPQKTTFPAVCVTRVSTVEAQHLRGPDAWSESRVQVDAFASTKAAADALSDVMHGDGLGTSASGLRGWIGSIGSPAFEIRNIVPLDAQEAYFPNELRLWKVSRDYRVFWRQV